MSSCFDVFCRICEIIPLFFFYSLSCTIGFAFFGAVFNVGTDFQFLDGRSAYLEQLKKMEKNAGKVLPNSNMHHGTKYNVPGNLQHLISAVLSCWPKAKKTRIQRILFKDLYFLKAALWIQTHCRLRSVTLVGSVFKKIKSVPDTDLRPTW